MTRPRWQRLLVVGMMLLCASSVGGGTGVAAVTNRAGSPTDIDACTTITSPGTYELTREVESERRETCIAVRADDVVLDGGGHTIDGESLRARSRAVAVGGSEPRSNVTVRDVGVHNWVYGVAVEDASEVVVEDVRTTQTVEGISVEDSADVTVADSTATNGFVGVSVVGSRRIAVRRTAVDFQSSIGVSVVESADVAVTNATVSDSLVGVALYDTARVGVADATVTGSSSVGVTVTDARRTRIAGSRLANAGGTTTATSGPTAETYESRDVALRNSTVETMRNLSLGGTTVSFAGDDVVLTGTGETTLPDAANATPVTATVTVAPYGADAGLSLSVRYTDAALRRAGVEARTLHLLDCRDGSCTTVAGPGQLDRTRHTVSMERRRIDSESAFVLVGNSSR